MNDYQWFNNDRDYEVSSFNEKLMINRGKWLTEFDNEINNDNSKVKLNDVETLPSGRVVVSYGPSSGKTTAIRQFIIKNYNKVTGVFSTKTIKDAKLIYYDIVSQLLYLGKIKDLSSIMLYTSDDRITIDNINKVKSSSWIICTHERLLIEPASILFTLPIDKIPYVVSSSKVYRQYLIIDEYPSSFSKKVKIRNTINIQLADKNCDACSIDDEFMRLLKRTSYISKITSLDSSQLEKGLAESLYLEVSPSGKLSLPQQQSDFDHDGTTERNISKLSFYYTYYAEELMKYLRDTPLDKQSRDDFIYYTINNLPASNMWIFDGTGDILFRDSPEYTIVNPDNYFRKLNVKSVNLIKSNVTRRSSSERIVEEFTSLINNILRTIDGKLLVYTWMNSNYESDSAGVLIEELKKSVKSDRVSFIYYQSGKERVTSEFSDCDSILIAGKFFIPNSAICELNNITKSNLTSYDYTKSLIIQALFRTSARHDKPINIFITDDYSDNQVRDIIDSSNPINFYNINIIESYTTGAKADCELMKLIISKCDDSGIISGRELSKLLGHKRFNSRNINKTLQSANITNYKYYKSERTGNGYEWSDPYYKFYK